VLCGLLKIFLKFRIYRCHPVHIALQKYVDLSMPKYIGGMHMAYTLHSQTIFRQFVTISLQTRVLPYMVIYLKSLF
jgi:hypothetical protein